MLGSGSESKKKGSARRRKANPRRRARQPSRTSRSRRSAAQRYETTAEAARLRRVSSLPRKRDWSKGRARPKSTSPRQTGGWLARKGKRSPSPTAHDRVGYRQEAYAPRGAYGARAGLRLNGNTVFNVLVLALLGWVLVWFFTSEQFYVGQVTISGNKRVSAEVLREVSGLQGYSVFWLNPRRVADRIVETLPPVRAVQVRYGFTDGDRLSAVVSLGVQEQGEQIMWQVAGQRYWVDKEGELHPVLGLVPGATAESFEPRLTINDIRVTPPQRIELEAIAAARELTHLLPEVRAIEYAPVTGLRLRHSRGWLVLLGTGDDMARKVSVLRAMEIEFAGAGVTQPTLVDLRYPGSPYYRLPSSETVEAAR